MAAIRMAALVTVAIVSAAGLFAQVPQVPTTQVLAILTVKDGVTRDQITKIMPVEVRDTVQMYLDGKIQQWFSRGDGKGVVFVLNCKTAEEAKSLTDALPLRKADLVTFDFMPLGPLTPLKQLLTPVQ
jgi:vancomycin permeability regulator SanA